ncbi:ROK family transcriptional regulator [Dendrosporobacter sp. 1207_IL3150]|uniref:ROK family transcriptional regulator n=1 Tax=Dendrosporobacter sp. 1207_IL3150 TaxID=3084054 RepID=UPI002FD90EE8
MREISAAKVKLGQGTNDAQVINLIRRFGKISRAEIAKQLGLTPPAVTNIINKLTEVKIIQEHMMGESNGGRRPVLLKINPNIARIIVVHIRSEKIMGYLVDAELTIHHQQVKDIRKCNKEEVLKLLLKIIESCRQSSDVSVAAAGVIVRGPVRLKEGISVFAPNIGWRNVPLKYIIEDKTGLPAFVENDSRALTNGEYYYGSVKDAQSMVMLKVSHGIGGGIIFNGKLYRGVNDSAGEVGHTTIDVTGPACSCGNYGCLEAMASENALVDLVIKAIKEGQPTLVKEYIGENLEDIEPEQIYKAADAGDDVAIRMLNRVARYLGIGIANLVNIFNPELIVIAGGIVRARKHIEGMVKQIVRERSFESCNSGLDIRFSDKATENTLRGATDLVFSEITELNMLNQQ